MSLLFHPYVVTAYLTSLLTFILGIFVWAKKPDSPVHRSFLIFSSSIAQWSLFTGLHAMQPDPWWSLVWSKTCHIGAMLIPVFFYYFTLKITGREKRVSLGLGFGLAFLLIGLNFATPLFIPNTRHDVGPPNFTNAGPLYFLMIAFFITYVLLSLAHLGKEIQHSAGTRKRHLQYLFYASIVGFSIGVINFSPVYGITIWPYPYSPLCGAIYASVIAYAILRHKLFDIELIVKKGLVFGILFGAVYGMVSGIIFLAGYFLARPPLPLLSGISIGLAMCLYEPLNGLLTRITHQFLFQKKLAYSLLIQSLTERLATLRDPEELAHEIVEFVTRQMVLEWAGLYAREEGNPGFKLLSLQGNPEPPDLKGFTPFESLLLQRKSPLLLSPFDLEEELQPELKAGLRKKKIEALLPIPVEERLFGILLLGKKKSDDAFSKEDEILLQTLIEEASMLFLAGKLLKEATRSSFELGQRMKMGALRKLSQGVHHEVRNPLHSIAFTASATLDDVRKGRYQSLSEEAFSLKIKERSRAILEDIERIKNSLGRFAEFAKPEKRVSLSSLSLKREVEKFMALMREGWKTEEIRVHQSIPEGLCVLAGEGALQEIFFNLYNNAYEAMKGKGEVFLEAREKGDFVEFRIKDTGPGIPPEILPNIFDEYFTTKKDSEAVGIGLTLTRHRVQGLGGSIEASSKPGEGAEFILKLKKGKAP